jgi:ABC-type cobalamin/Fe3+-siderophores transport system ATPase subunit
MDAEAAEPSRPNSRKRSAQEVAAVKNIPDRRRLVHFEHVEATPRKERYSMRGFVYLLTVFALSLSLAIIRGGGNVIPDSYRMEWRNISVVRNKRTIIQSVSGFALSGRVLGVIGPSGCGKSTLLRSLSMYASYRGEVLLTNSSHQQSVSKDDIAMLHQEDSFFSMVTVRETLKLYSFLRNLSPDSTAGNASSIDELLSTLNLLPVQDALVGSHVNSNDGKSRRGISGGERKRLALACALLHRPRVLIADEPTSGLDSHHPAESHRRCILRPEAFLLPLCAPPAALCAPGVSRPLD